MDKQREDFEKWYRDNYDNSVIDDTEYDWESKQYESSNYWCDELNQSWKAWQQAQKVAVPDTHVVVLKEPSAELVNHGHQVFLGHFNCGGQTGGRSLYFAYKAMIEAQENST